MAEQVISKDDLGVYDTNEEKNERLRELLLEMVGYDIISIDRGESKWNFTVNLPG